MRDKILSLVQQAGDEFYCAEPADVSEVKRIESVLELIFLRTMPGIYKNMVLGESAAQIFWGWALGSPSKL
jgi:hypothetical protein